MLNATAFAAALTGLVGWHPAAESNPAGPLHLLDTQLVSKSGLFVNDLNELLSLEVLSDCVPPGEILSRWIERLSKDAITRLVARLAASQSLDGKVLLSDAPLLKGPGRRDDTVNKQGRFVGIRVKLANKKGVAFTVPRLTIQLDTVQATPLPIYVYTDTQPDPVKVVTLPPNNNKPFYPYRYELEGNNAVDLSFATLPGQWAYIGYYESDLTGRAIQSEGIGVPCGCSADPYDLYSPFVTSARGFSVAAANLDPQRDAFTKEDVVIEPGNFGLDLFFTGYCDTASALSGNELTANQLQVAPIVQMALGIRFLEAITSSPNLTQITQRQALQADAYAALTRYQAMLYGGKDLSTESDYYPSMLKGVVFDFSMLDSSCFPQPKPRISMGTLSRR